MIEITSEYLHEQGLSENFPERYWPKVDVRGPDECWLWLGGKSPYGSIWCGRTATHKRQIGAHQAAWILCRGGIPDGLFVLHNCPHGDNRRCCNPAHLWLGTQFDNLSDMTQKGRRGKPMIGRCGEFAGKHRLTTEQVIEILNLASERRLRQKDIGAIFGCSQGHIGKIVRGEIWPHVPR